MTATHSSRAAFPADLPIRAGEAHRFEAEGHDFLYLVPSAAVFALDEVTSAILDALIDGPLTREALASRLAPRFDRNAIDNGLVELYRVHALRVDGSDDVVHPAPRQDSAPKPPPIPLQTLVLNVTNQCNLSCTYCYEYGEDRLVDTENGLKPKFMTEATARDAVDFMFREAGPSPTVRLTFFGGETLMNFPVLKTTVAYARQRAKDEGKRVEFSLTTNATLLRPDVIEFLAEQDVGVTISIDGPPDLQDRFRVFRDGAGSYDLIAPKIRELLAVHRSRPIGARVTLTRQTLDVRRIFRHLIDDIGFWEVGFAPVTTSPTRGYAIADEGFDRMLQQFRELADEFQAAAIANEHHGFSNVRDTIEEIHKGMSKSHPCGAGFGLLGVATDGDVALCHRFAGSDRHKLGTVSGGIDRSVQSAFLIDHHIDHKTDCRTCWARPLCAGGCYHEAQTRYGSTLRPNLHYCEWIRGWTDTCLRVYGAIAVRNPAFLRQFDASGDDLDLRAS
jgi:uncharacterized protein